METKIEKPINTLVTTLTRAVKRTQEALKELEEQIRLRGWEIPVDEEGDSVLQNKPLAS